MSLNEQSKFLEAQESACRTLERPPEPDEICPTCIPNEAYIAPDWWTMDTPYLDEKECAYRVGVVINQDGEDYRISDIGQEGSLVFSTLLKTYTRSGIRRMLRYYNKLETDEIVCAFPPQEPGQKCRGIANIDVSQYYTIDTGAIVNGQGEITVQNYQRIDDDAPFDNLQALELHAQTPDYRFVDGPNGMLAVLVSIPAYIFDQVPSEPELPEVDVNITKLVVNGREFYLQIRELIAAFKVYSKYQAYFYQNENGLLYFEESNEPFYISFYAPEKGNGRIERFVGLLSDLIEKNGFDWGQFTNPFKPAAFKIEITFDKSDETMPFTIKNVRVKKKGGCDFVKMKIGLQDFIKDTKPDQTALGWIANIEKMHKDLKARVTKPWLDFTIEYTFPQLSINYGSALTFGDQRPNSCLDDFNAINNVVLREVASFSKTFMYQLHQINCKLLKGDKPAFPEPKAWIDNEALQKQYGESISNLPILRFADAAGNIGSNAREFDEAFNSLEQDLGERGYNDDIFKSKSEHNFYKYAHVYSEFMADLSGSERQANEFNPLSDGLLELAHAVRFKTKEPKEALRAAINVLNPCNWKEVTTSILKCLLGGVPIGTAYLTVIKKTLSHISAEGLEIVIQALPADKQEEIRKKVEAEFGNLPMPWEPGWEAGDQSVAATRTAKNKMKELSEDLDDNKTLESTKLMLRKHFKTLKELRYVDGGGEETLVNFKMDDEEIYRIEYEYNIQEGYLEKNSINQNSSLFDPSTTVGDAKVQSEVDYNYQIKMTQEDIDELKRKWEEAHKKAEALREELKKLLEQGQGGSFVAGTTSIPHVYLHLGTAKLKAGRWRERDYRLADGTKVEVISKGEDESFNRTESDYYHWWYVNAYKDGPDQSPIQGWVMQILINKDC